ncbi:hypothetical protein C4D60_Mb03t04240 [Musa balbisiana]|uniref:Uncharacterized protein n=1 Tax=Musa balbisiana TaxID=52838 RepID=A0A4S8J7S5_MUSBA|nr:hypothetical protein C4D60_Mb03t04240 [Musa balbisiana]
MAGPPRVPISWGSTDATPARFASGVRSLLGYGRVPSPVPSSPPFALDRPIPPQFISQEI